LRMPVADTHAETKLSVAIADCLSVHACVACTTLDRHISNATDRSHACHVFSLLAIHISLFVSVHATPISSCTFESTHKQKQSTKLQARSTSITRVRVVEPSLHEHHTHTHMNACCMPVPPSLQPQASSTSSSYMDGTDAINAHMY
jgi:hypothetical protein